MPNSKFTLKYILKGWLLLSIVVFIAYNALWYITDPCPIIDFLRLSIEPDVISFSLIYSTVLPFVSLFSCWLLVRLRYFKKKSLARLALLAIVILTTNLTLGYLFEWTSEHFAPSYDATEYWMSMFVFSIIASLLSIIYIIVYYCRLIIRQSENNRRMKLATLKAQLNPHFMCNSLNVLSEMIREDTTAAELFSVKLASVFRYLIGNVGRNTAQVSDEMQNALDYLDLMQLRHPDSIEVAVDGSLLECHDLIVPLGVQLLIENAVKHNMHTASAPLRIEVGRKGQFLFVSNNLQPKKSATAKNPGTGLKNLNDRYMLLFHKQIEVEKGDDFFEVRIPIIQRDEYIDN